MVGGCYQIKKKRIQKKAHKRYQDLSSINMLENNIYFFLISEKTKSSNMVANDIKI